MAIQKSKVTKSRRNMRRSHDAITAAQRTKCSRCSASKLPHRICENCGFYRGKALLPIDEMAM